MAHLNVYVDPRYEDYDCAEIRAIPETYVHRSTDLVITRASERGAVKGFVVMPPLVCVSILSRGIASE